MKKLFIGGGVVIVLVIVAALVIPFLIPAETYKSQLLTQVRDATGREARIDGAFKISKRARLDARFLASLKSPLHTERSIRGDQLTDLVQIPAKSFLVCDRQNPRNPVGLQRHEQLIVRAEDEYISLKQRTKRSNSATRDHTVSGNFWKIEWNSVLV